MALNDRTPSENAAPLALLSIENLSVSYGHIQALKKASLEVFRGEIVVLIGANGAGKTTLLETALGINTPLAGGHPLEGQADRRGGGGP